MPASAHLLPYSTVCEDGCSERLRPACNPEGRLGESQRHSPRALGHRASSHLQPPDSQEKQTPLITTSSFLPKIFESVSMVRGWSDKKRVLYDACSHDALTCRSKCFPSKHPRTPLKKSNRSPRGILHPPSSLTTPIPKKTV